MLPTTSPARDTNLAKANPFHRHARCSALAFPTRSFTNRAGNGVCLPLFGRTALMISELITPDRGNASGFYVQLSCRRNGPRARISRAFLAFRCSCAKTWRNIPAGTLLVNISGSLVIGFFAGLTGPDARFLVNPSTRQVFHDRALRRLHHVLVFQPANTDTVPRRRIPIWHAKNRRLRHPLFAFSLAP